MLGFKSEHAPDARTDRHAGGFPYFVGKFEGRVFPRHLRGRDAKGNAAVEPAGVLGGDRREIPDLPPDLAGKGGRIEGGYPVDAAARLGEPGPEGRPSVPEGGHATHARYDDAAFRGHDARTVATPSAR